MRVIINISLPSPMVKTIKSTVKSENYMSISEFFRDLLRDWQAGKLLNELNESQREIKNEQGKILKSLRDLR